MRLMQEFRDGGQPQGSLTEEGSSPESRTGTTVTFAPDPAIFDSIDFRSQTLLERFQMMAFLNAGLKIVFRDDRVTSPVEA